MSVRTNTACIGLALAWTLTACATEEDWEAWESGAGPHEPELVELDHQAAASRSMGHATKDCVHCGAQPAGCAPTNTGDYCGCLEDGIWHEADWISRAECKETNHQRCFWLQP